MVRISHEIIDNLLKLLIAKRVCDMVNHANSSPAGGWLQQTNNVGGFVGASPCWRAGIACMFRCASLR